MADSNDEDDYMSMVFDDAPADSKYESSMQRAARKRKEAQSRAHQKTKAERAAEAEAAREASLATALPETNKGFKMMAKFGFKQGDSLGKSESARKEPIQVSIKEGRAGIGLESDKKRKMQEMWAQADREAKRQKAEEGDFLEERKQQQKEKKAERDLDNAQRTAERLEETNVEAKDGTSSTEKDVQSVNVLWRVRAQRRSEKEVEQRQKRELENSISSRLPDYVDDDEEGDHITRTALSLDVAPFYRSLEHDSDAEDPELADFQALPVFERLHRVLTYLRDVHRYCLYCGYQYPDSTMEGCPGLSEEDHD